MLTFEILLYIKLKEQKLKPKSAILALKVLQNYKTKFQRNWKKKDTDYFIILKMLNTFSY